MIAIVCTKPGGGFGAEAVLEECLHGWTPAFPKLVIVAPPESRAHQAALAKRLPFVPIGAGRDSWLNNLAAVHRIRAELKQCQLVHAWTARSFEPACWLGARLNVPVCGTLHDHPQAIFLSRPRQWLTRSTANRFSRLVCVSKAVEHACALSGYSVPTAVIHNGLRDQAVSRPETTHLRLGFLGMYATWKGFDIVSSWIEKTPENTRWSLYGHPDPSYAQKVEKLSAAHPHRVTLAGVATPEKIFSEVDVLIHASTHFDPLPTVLIEAGRAGIPSIASSLGGAPEIVEDGRTGFLFHPAQPDTGLARLQQLIEDTPLRSHMGEAARDRYDAAFRIDRMTRAYADLWSELVKPGGTPGE